MRPELQEDDESSLRSSTVRGNFTSGRRPLGSSSSVLSFSSPEAAILLVSTENHYLWPGPTPEVRDSWTSRYSAHALSQV